MLERIDLAKKISKDDYRKTIPILESKLAQLQRECRRQNIPIMIVFEGGGVSGKGVQIAELLHALDPRGVEVHTVKNENDGERKYPFLWRFWTKIPQKGRIGIYDSSWYCKVLEERFEKKIDEKEMTDAYESIQSFEKQLTDGGMVLIKLFLYIDKHEQKRRFEKLLEKKETAWRVGKGDLKRNRKFNKYKKLNEEMLQKTDVDYAPWTIIEATDKRFASVKIYTTVIDFLVLELQKRTGERKVEQENKIAIPNEDLQESILAKVDLTRSYNKEEYEKKIKKLQNKIEKLHGELYHKKIPVVLGFEGWDASGKGGVIKRLTKKMDPRGYVVYPISAPNDMEQAYHYLWRFWKSMPKKGHIAIFDRTWYGRVLVERIEGFCSKKEWQRAYKEINDMERDLVSAGTLVIKFWIHIDKEEQERRFKERQENPEKQWKITDEDWRNREKWEQYEEAINEMLIRTSTSDAPWIIVEGNCKYYARIKVLESVVCAIEERLNT